MPSPQTIDFAEIPVQTYGNPAIVLNQYSSAGLEIIYTSDNEDVATINGNTLNLHNAGTAQITATQSGDIDYEAAVPVVCPLIVEKALLSISADDKQREYGEENPELTYSISGLKNGEKQNVIDILPTVSTSANGNSNVGKYTIVVENASDNNYSFEYQNGNLEVTKAILTVSATNQTREYGEKNPELTVLYSGFKNNENETVLVVLPIVSCTAEIDSPVGIYDIVVSGAEAQNYSFLYVNGTLTITESAISILQEQLDTANETINTLQVLIADLERQLTECSEGNSISSPVVESLQIHPNPVRERFIVDGINENTLVTILDVDGKIVLQQMVLPNGSVLVSHLEQGVYFVQAKGKIAKMIKKQ